MNRLPKSLLIVFVISLLSTIGLGSYYLSLTNPTLQIAPGIKAIPYIVGIKDRLQIDSEIPGLNVTFTQRKKLEKAIGQSGFWNEGVRQSYDNGQLVKPTSLKFLLTGEEQHQARLAKGQDLQDKKLSASLGYEYNESTGQMILFIHYAPQFIDRLTEEELAHEVTSDLIFYAYLLAGDRNIKVEHTLLYPAANKFINSVLQKEEAWVKVR